MKLSKKNFYNIRDEKQTNIVKIKNLKSKTQNTQESHVIKHIDEIINYLEKIPSN